MTDKEILEKVLDGVASMIRKSREYTQKWGFFKVGKTLGKTDGGDIKEQPNYFYRFCKTSASYVVKDAPNIQVPAEHADNSGSRMYASKVERVLNFRWQGNRFVRKLKTATLRNSVFGDMYFMLSYNSDKKWVDLDVIDPQFMLYDTDDDTLLSEMTYVIRAKIVDVEKLKLKYPTFKDKIKSSNQITAFSTKDGFTKSVLWSDKKAAVFYLIDKEYIYTVINGEIIVEKEKHGFGFVPVYHRPYIDTGDKYGKSVIEIIYDSVKVLHTALSYILTTGFSTAVPPLVAYGTEPKFSATDGKLKGLITVPFNARIEYLNPPQSGLDLYKTLDFAKVSLHFMSGISEEAMAGFTGALTSAGVSIELRLDSTVREAIDSQVVLKDILEKINADGLSIMKKKMGSVNLLRTPNMGSWNKETPFTGSLLKDQFYNIVDFGGILPRSESTIVNNVLAKFNNKLISKDTALEELRYTDPNLEITKSVKETVDTAKLQKAIESGSYEGAVGFEGPQDENYWMVMNNKIAPVLPEQNHNEHYLEHKKFFDKTKNPMVMSHMMAHEQLSQSTGVQSGEAIYKMNQEQNMREPVTPNGIPQ